ncbi:MAG: aldehyde dehydrogenase family protein [Streptomyces sp.]|nr:aldehyde dehydrogenase family protein [Streptomyces sp.]NUS27132.1 aldehyde dehydrogenase family protein [Streptomyces sp.]NUS77324.1 aldehyde dehydrogenase family protein [Streptomyces sp.]
MCVAVRRHGVIVHVFHDRPRRGGGSSPFRPDGVSDPSPVPVPADGTSGCFVEPTLFDRGTPDLRTTQEEIFGPVLSVLTHGDEEEAVALANGAATA